MVSGLGKRRKTLEMGATPPKKNRCCEPTVVLGKGYIQQGAVLSRIVVRAKVNSAGNRRCFRRVQCGRATGSCGKAVNGASSEKKGSTAGIESARRDGGAIPAGGKSLPFIVSNKSGHEMCYQ